MEDIKQFFNERRTAIIIVAVILLLLLGALYLTSDDSFTVPKSAQDARNNSNVAHQQSVNAESQANASGAVANEISRQRQEIKTKIDRIKAENKKAETNLERTKKEYDKVKSPVSIDNSNLDERERRLRADLDQLYWQQK